MNKVKEYFLRSFYPKKWIHMAIVIIASLTLFLILFFLKWQNNDSLRVAADSTFVIGMTFFVYGIIILIFQMGFGLSLFRKNKYKEENDLNNEIQNEKSKKRTKASELRLAYLNEKYKKAVNEREIKDSNKKYVLMEVLISIIGIILLIISGIISNNLI
ncbi:Uncharacterised protein [Mycoplasmopsis maculosa]|uniref:DUF3899 domain-containing protein n=1 Tax=Mycoplasmopsis maculosa TaxID=114885 RepID=A0A449B5E5_9BACT|nr:hypothetical protein [Mycoplasmopsis maculosa]VEU75820.1 Uncharacterised protein [Mycoplasmopsis maculosa]